MATEQHEPTPGVGAPDIEQAVAALPGAFAPHDRDTDWHELASRYKSLLDHCSFPVTYVDPEGRFLAINKVGAANLGASPDDIPGRSIADYFPSSIASLYRERLRRVADSGETTSFEDEVPLPSGETRWYRSILHPLPNATGEVHGIQIVSHDITDSKRIEQELEDRLRFEQLIANLSCDFVNSGLDGVDRAVTAGLREIGSLMDVDRCVLFELSSDQRVLDCRYEWHASGHSSVAGLQQQYSADFTWFFWQVLRGSPVEISSIDELPNEAAAERAYFQSTGVQSFVAVPILLGGDAWGSLCLERLSKTGAWPKELATRLTAVGQIMGASLMQVKAETELQKRRDQLFRVARLNTVGELIGGIAHEVSQPLYAILNYAKAIDNVLCDSQEETMREATTWSRQIAKSASDAGEIVRRLRRFAEQSSEEPGQIRIAHLVEDAIEMVSHEARKHGVEITLEGPTCINIDVDRVQMLHAIVHLLQNAIGASAAADQTPPRVKVLVADRGNSVDLSITDYGATMPRKPTANVFDALMSGEEDTVGMGLTISKRLVEDHGGDLVVEHSEGGNTVCISLPVSRGGWDGG